MPFYVFNDVCASEPKLLSTPKNGINVHQVWQCTESTEKQALSFICLKFYKKQATFARCQHVNMRDFFLARVDRTNFNLHMRVISDELAQIGTYRPQTDSDVNFVLSHVS